MLAGLGGHDERGHSFIDGTSFVLMRTNSAGIAYAVDDDFSAAGFVEFRP